MVPPAICVQDAVDVPPVPPLLLPLPPPVPLLLPLPPPLLPPLPPPLVHWLWQFESSHCSSGPRACVHEDSISFWVQEELCAALALYVPPGHAHET